MDIKKIIFTNNRPWLNKDSLFKPTPILKTIPEWYRKMDRFIKNPQNNDFYIGQDGGKMPTWKACPAVFDVMGSGYTYLTPCDINFIQSENGLSVEIEDLKYKDFCTPRSKMDGFVTPHGYRDDHFAWFADWGIQVPEGYSVLYTHPLNRFELPFYTISGIVDNDKVLLPGSMPFFINKEFSGILPKGTPIVQMIPFKRDNWESEFNIISPNVIVHKNIANSKIYRKPNGGIYKNKIWEQRTYK